jgi:NADH:ubiquinone oxidoreductase subunit 5 (subunit L)/multisubunit Na+/H+ antiporter MnhA subunit
VRDSGWRSRRLAAGSIEALNRYSTVAQLGYLFLIFPLASAAEPFSSGVSLALTSGMFQVMAHAFAKAAMFMAAGLIAEALAIIQPCRHIARPRQKVAREFGATEVA